MSLKYKGLIVMVVLVVCGASGAAAQVDNVYVKGLIQQWKEDARGPYKDIRWFCPDGTVIGAKETCSEPGGHQRARYKDEVVRLSAKHDIYLGQILKGTPFEDFYDSKSDYTQAKQYLIEQFLKTRDDGWVLQKGQYYRGAIQAEDEESWGRDFLLWLVDNSRYDHEFYFLARGLVRTIPHGGADNVVQSIRSLSKTISDRQTTFLDIRSKIHGSPDASDVAKVKAYQEQRADKLSPKDQEELQLLITTMEVYYGSRFATEMARLQRQLEASSSVAGDLTTLLAEIKAAAITDDHLIRGIDLLATVKTKLEDRRSANSRLLHLDISNVLEQYLLSQLSTWQPSSIADHLTKACYLGQMLNATGYTYDWEYDHLLADYTSVPTERVSFDRLLSYYKAMRRHINWGSGMIETEYGREIALYAGFEPLAVGFTDDQIRSSALLPLGEAAASLYEYLVRVAGWRNQVFGKTYASIQGINPGYARGKLVVVDNLDGQQVDPAAIYLLRTPPSDMEPVAGILSISEGNLVSHLQLLARNLGIPNANVSEELYTAMKRYDGQEVFYAVSNRGGVKLITSDDMSAEERSLFAVRQIDEEVVTVPVDQMELTRQRIYSLTEIDATSSGVICGPKAANFAALKQIFPHQLVDGLVVPFAVFRDHMQQLIPGGQGSYWDHLTQTFATVRDEEQNGTAIDVIERYTTDRLTALSSLIKEMPLRPAFVDSLERAFIAEFGQALGKVPVFLRSDTNMEDLKDFTGAGLNLTIFNTTAREKIIQGIKDVWASPYSERSYKWRQRYLTNPQDVYPSILIIPSVVVDYSGVVITKDFAEGREHRVNLALSQGVGGAVDGQRAEAWVLDPAGRDLLLAPARDRHYKRLGSTEGTTQGVAQLDRQMLTTANKADIWSILASVYQHMPASGMQAPYDVELGFADGKLWLFQIRPFVENKKATSSSYLATLDPSIPSDKYIVLKNTYEY